MGYDARCTLKMDGETTEGTAWLEHKDLVFRGPTRLAIPLARISTAIADRGVLRVRFGAKSADFVIGPAAEKWAARITNPPSRLDKLGVKPGMRVAAVDVPDDAFLQEIAARGAEVTRVTRVGSNQTADLVFFGAADRRALTRLASLRRIIAPAGAVWVVRPKGSSDITEAETMAAGKRAGLVDVKVVSFSDALTAEKFVIPVAERDTVVNTPRTTAPRRALRRK